MDIRSLLKGMLPAALALSMVATSCQPDPAPAPEPNTFLCTYVPVKSNLPPEVTPATPWEPEPNTTERISVTDDGLDLNGHSGNASISADGRYVAFSSNASNIVPGDSNKCSDVFVLDRQNRTTKRVSVSTSGSESNGPSSWPSISADGRYIAFLSLSTNLVVGGPTKLAMGVFVHDLQTANTTSVPLPSDDSLTGPGDAYWSTARPSISADGRYVVFTSKNSNLVPDDTNEAWDVFVYDRVEGVTTRVSVASDGTESEGQSLDGIPASSISNDGRFVAFDSTATDLVPGDTNGVKDVFVHDRESGSTTRVSLASDGTQSAGPSSSPSISADGRYVAFSSANSNFDPENCTASTDVFVHDRVTAVTSCVPLADNGHDVALRSANPSISADGRYVAFETWVIVPDGGEWMTARVYDRDGGATQTVSVRNDGRWVSRYKLSVAISGDGRYAVVPTYDFNNNPWHYSPGFEGDIYVRGPITW